VSQHKYISFMIGDLLFGIDILLIKEVNTRLELTTVHNVNEAIEGIANLRGQILTIIDLGKKLNINTEYSFRESAVIVLKTENELDQFHKSNLLSEHSSLEKVGFKVDKILDVIEIDEKKTQSAPANFVQIESKHIRGLYQNPIENKLQVLLNLESCLEFEKITNTLE